MASTLHKWIYTWVHRLQCFQAWWKFYLSQWDHKRTLWHFYHLSLFLSTILLSTHRFFMNSRYGRCDRKRNVVILICEARPDFFCSPVRTPSPKGPERSKSWKNYHKIVLHSQNVPITWINLLLIQRPNSDSDKDIGLWRWSLFLFHFEFYQIATYKPIIMFSFNFISIFLCLIPSLLYFVQSMKDNNFVEIKNEPIYFTHLQQ